MVSSHFKCEKRLTNVHEIANYKHQLDYIFLSSVFFPPGVHYVFDITIAADFSILESQKEFVQRYHHHNQEEHALPMFASACPGKKFTPRH